MVIIKSKISVAFFHYLNTIKIGTSPGDARVSCQHEQSCGSRTGGSFFIYFASFAVIKKFEFLTNQSLNILILIMPLTGQYYQILFAVADVDESVHIIDAAAVRFPAL